MKHLRIGMAFLVVAALLVGFSAQADAQKKKKGKKGKAYSGKVLEAKKDSLKIMTKGNKKKNTEGKEMTFKITDACKVFKASGKKKERPTAAEYSDVTTGTNVQVFVSADDPDTATRIVITAKKRKKKGN